MSICQLISCFLKPLSFLLVTWHDNWVSKRKNKCLWFCWIWFKKEWPAVKRIMDVLGGQRAWRGAILAIDVPSHQKHPQSPQMCENCDGDLARSPQDTYQQAMTAPPKSDMFECNAVFPYHVSSVPTTGHRCASEYTWKFSLISSVLLSFLDESGHVPQFDVLHTLRAAAVSPWSKRDDSTKSQGLRRKDLQQSTLWLTLESVTAFNEWKTYTVHHSDQAKVIVSNTVHRAALTR